MIGCTSSCEQTSHLAVLWALLCVIPLLLAAELIQRTDASIQLPAQETYRSDLSERILKSSMWRQAIPAQPDWRAPASPKIEWQQNATHGPSPSVELQDVDLYPDYRPGGSSTFDLSTREDQSLIKIFEFDFGR